jgi:hypothetical protein
VECFKVNILQDIVQDIVIDFSVVRVTLLGIVQNVPNCSGLFPIVAYRVTLLGIV